LSGEVADYPLCERLSDGRLIGRMRVRAGGIVACVRVRGLSARIVPLLVRGDRVTVVGTWRRKVFRAQRIHVATPVRWRCKLVSAPGAAR